MLDGVDWNIVIGVAYICIALIASGFMLDDTDASLGGGELILGMVWPVIILIGVGAYLSSRTRKWRGNALD